MDETRGSLRPPCNCAVAVCCVAVTALRIHISKPCYIGLLEIGGYEMTLRGEMNVKVFIVRFQTSVSS